MVVPCRAGGFFSASPLFAVGGIYFPGDDGEVLVVAAADEFRLLATIHLGMVSNTGT